MWVEAYRAACAEVSAEVREDVSSSGASGELVVRGNSFDNFKRRVSDTDVRAIVAALRVCPGLAALYLPYNNISDDGGALLGRALGHQLDTIITLDLQHNSLGPEAGVAIAEGLQRNDSLCHVMLAGNALTSRCGAAFGAALRVNVSLAVLDLYSTDMDMPALVHICHALGVNRGLLSLNIGRPLLHGVDELESVVHHLSTALQRNTTLEELHMAHFGLVDDCLQTLVLALCGSAVTTLNVRGNKLSQDAGRLLARLLDRRHDFRSIDVSCNRLCDAGAAALAKGLAHHPQLEALAMQSCSVGERGLVELVGGLTSCSGLRRLSLWGNDVTPAVASALTATFGDLCDMDQVDVGIAEQGGQLVAYRA
ncbi:Leucine Rich repeat [Novymonas esmeraldas]|uniref:Leucine Rich repeat n=1 Tax=Novymonas esmeraldas TaxID=1808958 RepID=A0AAW0EX20_9TRYP